MSEEEELVSRLRVEAEDKTGEVLKGIAERIEKVKRGMEGLASGTVLGKSYMEYANFQRTLERLGFQIGITKKQVNDAAKQMKDMADETGLSLDKLTSSFYDYVTLSGQKYEDAAKIYRKLGDAYKVTGLDIELFAKAAAAATHDMKVKSIADVDEVVSFWATKLPVAMLGPFLQQSGRVMQIMQEMGLSGKKNAEEIALAFGEVVKSGIPARYALRELNTLLDTAYKADTRLGKQMLMPFKEIRERGGDINEYFKAIGHVLRTNKSLEQDMIPFLQQRTGLSFDAAKALIGVIEHMDDLTNATKGAAGASAQLDKQVKTTNDDALSALTHMKGAIEDIGLGIGNLVDELGGTWLLQKTAGAFDDISRALGFINTEIDLLTNGKIGKAAEELKKLETRQGAKEAARVGGAVAGAIAGAEIGGSIGSVVPIVGNIAGGTLGAAVGAGLGATGAGKVFDYQHLKETPGQRYIREHAPGGIKHYAKGGIATQPTLATVAEEGPEAIIPLSGGTGGGGGSTKANTEAVKENTAVLKRLLTEGQLSRSGSGLKAAYTPGAGELPTPADAELYGGLTPGGYGGRMVQTVRTDGSGNVIGGVPSASLPSGMATSNIHVPNVIHQGQVPRHSTITTTPLSPAPPTTGARGPIDRSRFVRELQQKPWLRNRIMQIAANEQGANPAGTQAVLESMMNRAAVRGTSLEAQATWHNYATGAGYYDPANRERAAHMLGNEHIRGILEHSLGQALGGSNTINYGTDNASGNFARGEISRGQFKETVPPIHGEYFMSPGSSERGLVPKFNAWVHQQQQMLNAHRQMRQEIERPMQLRMNAPPSVGARQRISSLQSRWFAEDMLGTPRWNSQLDIGFS